MFRLSRSVNTRLEPLKPIKILLFQFQLLSIDDNFVSLMDMDTCDTKDDLKLPEGELGDQIKQAFEKEENGIMLSGD